MPAKREPLFKSRSATYPDRSDSEATSKHMLMDLLDNRFVRGELRIMDKYPNADGILDVTEADGYIRGKIDVQLKTLPKSRTTTPAHACEMSFLQYCEESILPVILIAVDQAGRKAYWQNMNYEVLSSVRSKITGKTFSLALPLENCIDGQSLAYVDKWKQICAATYEKTWNYDALKADYEKQEAELASLREKFGPLTLDAPQVREIQQFLDIYNDLLDHDFRLIKRARYSNFWKIGLGIMRYSKEECSFIVYPIPYGTNETLIRQVKPGSIKDIGREFVLGTMLRAQSYNNGNPISESAETLAYEMIESDFKYLIDRVQFEVPDDFMANEYIHGFTSRFATFLDLDGAAESYDLDDLHFLVNDVLPQLLDIRLNIPEGQKRFTQNIDSYQKLKPHANHRQSLMEARKRATKGHITKFNIEPVSSAFDVDILKLYIDHLRTQGIRQTRRVYDPNTSIQSTGGFIWESWNNKVLISNVSTVIHNLKRVYQLVIERYFPGLAKDLELFRDGNLLLYCLSFEHGRHAGPQLEYYKLRSHAKLPAEVRFCTSADRPFTRESLMDQEGWTMRINKKVYELHISGGEKVVFIFEPLPMHTFVRLLVKQGINAMLSKKAKGDK
jgi:hypothetical protein